MRKRIWFNPEAEYIGATGVDTVHGMAELALLNGDIPDVLGLADGATVEQIEEALNFHEVHPVTVGASTFWKERWPDDRMYPCAIDASPGRGFVKVLGVNL
jgi:hypothetical protein